MKLFINNIGYCSLPLYLTCTLSSFFRRQSIDANWGWRWVWRANRVRGYGCRFWGKIDLVWQVDGFGLRTPILQCYVNEKYNRQLRFVLPSALFLRNQRSCVAYWRVYECKNCLFKLLNFKRKRALIFFWLWVSNE